MTASPYFRCLYESTRHPDGRLACHIRGRFELRRPDPGSPSVSGFTPPTRFHLDTGAMETAVDDAFAVLHGFGNFRHSGVPVTVNWFNSAATPIPAWRLYRWVRFRDFRDGVRPFPTGDSGGLAHLEFRIAFLVVPNVSITTPLFGVRDMHNYFTLTSSANVYSFLPRRVSGAYPTATDGGQGVREIP